MNVVRRGRDARLGGTVVSNGYHSNASTNTDASSNDQPKKLSKKLEQQPTLVELRGVPIHFPFVPYQCQSDYMSKVLEALQNSENALLESPTGTGKTLCLLCSTLAWQREQCRISSTEMSSTSNTKTLSQSSQSITTNNKNAHSQSAKSTPTIVYASRTHSQLSQVVRELKSTRYRPMHAVLGSREQMCVHDRVLKNVKDNPALSINHECSKLTKNRKCNYRNNLDGFTGPSPETFTTGDLPGTQPVLDIEDLSTMGKVHKVCPFYYTRDSVKTADLVLLPYNYLFDREARSSIDVNWENAILIFDEAHNLESFASDATSFDISGLDLAGCIQEVQRAAGICSQNSHYAGGADDGGGSQVKLDNIVVLKSIFLRLEEFLDNVPPKGGSYDGNYIFEFFKHGNVNYKTQELFGSFVRKVSDVIMEATGAASSGTPKLDHFQSCVKRAFSGNSEASCLAKTRAYRVHVSPKKEGSKEPRTMSYWCFAPSLAMRELSDLGLRSILVTSGTLSPLLSFSLELGLDFPIQLENSHVIQPHQVHVRVIGHGVSNKLLKSTYDRRDNPEYLLELGNTLVSLSKIIPDGVLVFFPSYGVMDACVEAWGGPARRPTWQKNNNNKQQNFFAKRGKKQNSSSAKKYSFPFAPNYYTSTNGTAATPWTRLLSSKSIVLEPKSSSDLKDALSEFHKFIDNPQSKGCFLMGVCRGKISEGIDFADKAARAVIITGLPFAPYMDPKVKLKREFLDCAKATHSVRPSGDGGFGPGAGGSASQASRGGGGDQVLGISGSEWYAQQAHRAVNQAVGRTIRHRFDWGAILLLDARFGDERNQSGMSKWVRPYTLPDQGFGRAISGLAKFFRNAANDESLVKKKALPTSLSTTTRRRKLATALTYEDEEVQNTNIAVIQTKSDCSSRNFDATTANSSVNSDDYVRPENVITRFVVKEKDEQVNFTKSFKNIVDESNHGIRLGNQAHNASETGLSALYTKRKQNQLVTTKTKRFVVQTNHPHKMAPPSACVDGSLSKTVVSAWARVGSSASALAASGSNGTTSQHAPLPFQPFVDRYKQQQQLKQQPTNKANGSNKNSSITSINDSQGTSRNSSSVASAHNSPESSATTTQKSNNAARVFFSAAQSTMSTSDFAKLRTLLVKMKQSGDVRDSRCYLQIAKQLIELLLQYDAKKKNNICSNSFVDKLLPLLPIKHRATVQAMSLDMKSKIRMEQLQKAEANHTGDRAVNTVLFRKRTSTAIEQQQQEAPSLNTKPKKSMNPYSVHGTPRGGQVQQNKQQADQNGSLNQRRVMMPFEGKKIPGQLSHHSQRKRVENTTQQYNSNKTARINGTRVFRKTNDIRGQKPGERIEEPLKTPPPELHNKKRFPLDHNPRNSVRGVLQQKLHTNIGVGIKNELITPKEKRNQTISKTTPDTDTINRYVEQAASSPYIQPTPEHEVRRRELTRRIQSNANIPSNLVCKLCFTKPKQPMLAPCGHTACHRCWTRWFLSEASNKATGSSGVSRVRQGSCPVCREPTTMESLSHMVFHNKDASLSSQIPTLSQICPTGIRYDNNDGDEDDENDDELLIVK